MAPVQQEKSVPNLPPLRETILVLVVSLSVVCAFTDLRSIPCMTPYLQNLVPPKRSVWSGVIQLSLVCHSGFDIALNSPLDGRFECKPDGKPWKPDFIPDCNPLMRPQSIAIKVIISHSTLCSSLITAKVSSDNSSIVFASRTVNILELCQRSKISSSCRVASLLLACSNNESKLFLKLTTKFSDAVNSELVRGESTSLIDSLVQQMNIPNNASMPHVIDGEGCQPGTLGAYDDKIGAVCRGCSLGHYLSSNNTCLPCPPGYYSDVPLRQRCNVCPGLVSVAENVWAKVNATGQWMAFAISMCPKFYNEPNVNLSIAKALEAINKAYNSSNRPEVCIVVCVFLMLLYGLVEGKLSR